MGRPQRKLLLPWAVAATLLVAAGASARGAVQPSFRTNVIGGSTAAAGRFPWLAFIYTYDSTGVGQCTGTVVSPNVILTAAHCLLDSRTGQPLAPRAVGVVTGTLDWSQASGRRVSGVTHVILNPSYDDRSGRDDAALLVLASPTTAPSITLQSSADPSASAPGRTAVFAGWGQTNGSDPMSTANTLQWARTVIRDGAYCRDNVAPFDPRTQLCADHSPTYDTSVCFGDSGGPLIATDVQVPSRTPVEVGIVRASPVGCDPTGDDIFTAVQAISAWADYVITAEANDPPVAVTPPPLPFSVDLSRLGIAAVKRYVDDGLSVRFGARFDSGDGYASRCSARSAYRVRCAVSWHAGTVSYRGHVSVFYVVADGSAVWSNRYSVKWVSDRCSFHTAQAGCRVSRARGTFVVSVAARKRVKARGERP